MSIDVEKLVVILRLWKEDVKKLADSDTIQEERNVLGIELTNSLDKLINKLNDKRISIRKGSDSGS